MPIAITAIAVHKITTSNIGFSPMYLPISIGLGDIIKTGPKPRLITDRFRDAIVALLLEAIQARCDSVEPQHQ